MSVVLPDELIPTDGLLRRWGRALVENERGGMHPLERIRLMHDGAVLSGVREDGQWFDIVDVEVSRAPETVRRVIKAWYGNRGSSAVKASRLGMSRAQLYVEWRGALRYMQGVLRDKLSTLL